MEKIGVIKGIDLVKKNKPMQNIPFRTGKHMTEKDRPRKKIRPRDIDKYL